MDEKKNIDLNRFKSIIINFSGKILGCFRARDPSTILPVKFIVELVKQDNSIISAFKVQKRLDLEDMRTGFNYLQRFAKDIISRSEV